MGGKEIEREMRGGRMEKKKIFHRLLGILVFVALGILGLAGVESQFPKQPQPFSKVGVRFAYPIIILFFFNLIARVVKLNNKQLVIFWLIGAILMLLTAIGRYVRQNLWLGAITYNPLDSFLYGIPIAIIGGLLIYTLRDKNK